jgi:SAM-dependent methyltransferase
MKEVIQNDPRAPLPLPPQKKPSSIVTLLRRSASFECFYQMLRNLLVPMFRTTFGHARFSEYADPATSARYALDVHRFYMDVIATVPDFSLRGARVLEVAPGQTMATTVPFLVDGAAEVTGLDKYARVPLPPDYEHAIYERLFALMERPELASLAFTRFEREGLVFSGRVRFVDRCAVEAVADAFPPDSFDLICSNLVVNHVRDLATAYRACFRALKPGGLMIHNVHFWHHHAFEREGLFHYLSVSDPVWQLMTSRMYAVNRKSGEDHRRFAAAAGFKEVEILVDEAHRHPAEEASLYLKRHPKETRTVADLTARYFALRARKPGR